MGTASSLHDERSLLHIDPQGQRRTRREAAAVRAALAGGREVAFASRRQWRHYQYGNSSQRE